MVLNVIKEKFVVNFIKIKFGNFMMLNIVRDKLILVGTSIVLFCGILYITEIVVFVFRGKEN